MSEQGKPSELTRRCPNCGTFVVRWATRCWSCKEPLSRQDGIWTRLKRRELWPAPIPELLKWGLYAVAFLWPPAGLIPAAILQLSASNYNREVGRTCAVITFAVALIMLAGRVLRPLF